MLLGDWNVLVLYVAAAAINADITKDRYQFYISSEFPLVLETKVIRMFPKISQSRRRPLHEGRAAIRNYANQTARPL